MAGDTKTILVVDDEPDVRTFLEALLEDHGYTVVTAENGAEAEAQLAEQRPDLITLDVNMPEKSGVRFYRELRESAATRDIPVIIVTGMAPEFEGFIKSRGSVPPPDGFHPKPIEPEKILKMIAALIED